MIDQRLQDTVFLNYCGWGKVLSHLKKHFDQWAIKQLTANGHKDFKIVYMPVIMNIDPEGTSNNDLALRAMVTKQAMSKVVKELQKLGYISAKTDPKDKRSIIFSLTKKGTKFVTKAKTCVRDLMDEYRSVVGKKSFDDLLQKMLILIQYHQHLDA
jgi:DNA-binding MarR family transcriptional regulator